MIKQKPKRKKKVVKRATDELMDLFVLMKIREFRIEEVQESVGITEEIEFEGKEEEEFVVGNDGGLVSKPIEAAEFGGDFIGELFDDEDAVTVQQGCEECERFAVQFGIDEPNDFLRVGGGGGV